MKSGNSGAWPNVVRPTVVSDGTFAPEPTQAILDVGGISGLAHLAVVEYVHPGVGLLAHGLRNGCDHLGVERALIDLLAGFLGEDQGKQLVGTRQTPGVRRQDPLGASLHQFPPSCSSGARHSARGPHDLPAEVRFTGGDRTPSGWFLAIGRSGVSAGSHRLGGWLTADRRESSRGQRMDNQFVLGRIGGDVEVAPKDDRVDLDQVAASVPPDHRGVGALRTVGTT